MNNILKFRIVALVMAFGLSLSACDEKPEKDKKITGTVTADEEGTISFMYSRTKNSFPAVCAFTTDLPSPDDQFVLTIVSGETSAKKDIDGLTEGKNVSWTATVEGEPLNHGSDNFVHIVND
jgi:hypothetical protein